MSLEKEKRANCNNDSNNSNHNQEHGRMTNPTHPHEKRDCEEGAVKVLSLVEFCIEDVVHLLPAARYYVSDIKKLGKIDPSHKLAIELATGPEFLKNDGTVRIDGGEKFEGFSGCGKAS